MSRRKNAYYPWGLFGYTLSYQAFSNRVQFYYIDVLGLGSAAISAVWLMCFRCSRPAALLRRITSKRSRTLATSVPSLTLAKLIALPPPPGWVVSRGSATGIDAISDRDGSAPLSSR